MTSAEKIISGIINEATKKAEQIIENAQKEADDIIKSSQREAELQADEIIKDASLRADVLRSTGKSGAELIVRDAALRVKREEIDRTLSTAAERINALPDGEYFAFLTEVAKKSSMSGQLCLSKKDNSRDISVLKQMLSGTDITVSDQFADINGGFILKCGDIEINAEPEALINERREELIDSINKILFKEV